MILRLLGIGAAVTLTVLGLTASVHAAPFDPHLVPADVKWVAHLNGDALRNSPAMQAYVKHCLPHRSPGKVTDSSHSDPCAALDFNKLQDVTLYGTRIAHRNGVAIVRGAWDRDQFLQKLKAEKDVKIHESDGQTVFTWTKFKGTDCAHEISLGFPKPNVLVIASSPDLLHSAIALLDGKGMSLAGTKSALTAAEPKGTVLMARGMNLTAADIGPHFSVFRLINGFDYHFTDNEGRVTEELSLQASSEKIAQKLNTLCQGLLAATELVFDERPELLNILKNARVEQKGREVRFWYHASSEELARQLPKVCDEFRDQWKARQAMLHQLLGEKRPTDAEKSANP